jgi:putative endonuclease
VGLYYLNKTLLMHTVYAIQSLTRNYIYVGMTTDLDTRLIHHNRGYNKKTKAYRPFLLIYTQEFSTRLEARNHEKYLKSGSGKEYLKENYTRT